MSIFTGRKVDVGIGRETDRGTGVAAAYWIPKTDISFDDKISKALVAGSYGNISHAPMTTALVGKWAEGDISGELNINSFGLLLYAVLGLDTPSTDDPEANVNTHAYTMADNNQNPSLTIEASDPIGDMRFRLAMINMLSMEVALGEFVTYTANFIAKASQDSSSTVSYSSDVRFTSRDLTFKVANSIGEIAAATAVSVRSLTLEIEKVAEKLEVLGTFEPEDIVNKGLAITGSIELTYEDRTWRDYMANDSTKAMQIQLESKTETIGTTTKPKLNFIFPKVHFHTWESARGLDDIATQTLNFQVLLDIKSDPKRLWSTADLINTIAAY